eukprot:TRINITY_DN5215_c0_g1_i2.p1 TRINITY_DN5215_c0_g1~~TRINITY_DN5215_c0_g1_i2.p1  ORF type:complete len:156 (+),score=15.59 TRINITY_DN5215_c0_g1_i2:121-588(+)
MAKIIALAFCFFGIVAVAAAADFVVEGSVYCDTCETGFPTRVSYPLKDAKVEVECKKDGKQTYYVSGKTNAKGDFSLTCKGEHEHEFCVARTVSASGPCSIRTENFEGPVYLTNNNGIASNVRKTGPFAYKSTSTLGTCNAVLAEYHLYDDDDEE